VTGGSEGRDSPRGPRETPQAARKKTAQGPGGETSAMPFGTAHAKAWADYHMVSPGKDKKLAPSTTRGWTLTRRPTTHRHTRDADAPASIRSKHCQLSITASGTIDSHGSDRRQSRRPARIGELPGDYGQGRHQPGQRHPTGLASRSRRMRWMRDGDGSIPPTRRRPDRLFGSLTGMGRRE